MTKLRWWMRVIGALYVFVFFAAVVLRIPIRAEGPAGILERAEAHDLTAIFILDTWTMFGLFMLAVGVGLLRFSRDPQAARALVWTVMGLELSGLVTDINKISHVPALAPPIVWMAIHTAAIVTGYVFLRGASRAGIESAPNALNEA